MSDEGAFTPLEEAFFRQGEEEQQAETELEEGAQRRPFLRRLFSRKTTQQ